MPPVPLAPGLAVGSWELQGGALRLAVAAAAARRRRRHAERMGPRWQRHALRMSVNDGNDFSWVRLAPPPTANPAPPTATVTSGRAGSLV